MEKVCGFCKWMAWPEMVCTNGDSDRCADFILNNDKACMFIEPNGDEKDVDEDGNT